MTSAIYETKHIFMGEPSIVLRWRYILFVWMSRCWGKERVHCTNWDEKSLSWILCNYVVLRTCHYKLMFSSLLEFFAIDNFLCRILAFLTVYLLYQSIITTFTTSQWKFHIETSSQQRCFTLFVFIRPPVTTYLLPKANRLACIPNTCVYRRIY